MRFVASVRRILVLVLLFGGVLTAFVLSSSPSAAINVPESDPVLNAVLRAQARMAANLRTCEYSVRWESGRGGMLGQMTVIEQSNVEVLRDEDSCRMVYTTQTDDGSARRRAILMRGNETLQVQFGDPGKILRLKLEQDALEYRAFLRGISEPNIEALAYGASELTLQERMLAYPMTTWSASQAVGLPNCFRVAQRDSDGNTLSEYLVDGNKGFMVTEAAFYTSKGIEMRKVFIRPARMGGTWFPEFVSVKSEDAQTRCTVTGLQVGRDIPRSSFTLQSLEEDFSDYSIRDFSFSPKRTLENITTSTVPLSDLL